MQGQQLQARLQLLPEGIPIVESIEEAPTRKLQEESAQFPIYLRILSVHEHVQGQHGEAR